MLQRSRKGLLSGRSFVTLVQVTASRQLAAGETPGLARLAFTWRGKCSYAFDPEGTLPAKGAARDRAGYVRGCLVSCILFVPTVLVLGFRSPSRSCRR